MDRAEPPRHRVAVVLFEGFELLDVYGPLEMLGVLRDRFDITLLGPDAGPVASAQGPRAHADCSYADAPSSDVVLVPGGIGTRRLVDDGGFLAWLAEYAPDARYAVSVCTGAAVLAAAGLLDGYRATSNKRAFGWVRGHGRSVEWVPEARWVEDRDRWTSSGVAAGIDMALALVAHLYGAAVANAVADGAEYEWHTDPTWEPFAAKNDLVPSPPSSGA
jgi:transcriptional regulator GlxA family with amidase domain